MSKSFNYAASFTSEIVGASFNEQIQHAANNGQIAHCLTLAALASGIVIAAKPVKFVSELNASYLQQGTKAPKAAIIKIVQALHALAVALHDSGKVNGLPELNALPSWADPVAIEAAKAAKAAKAAAAKAAKAAASEDDSDTAIIAPVAAVAVAPVAALDLEHFLRAIRNNEYNAKEIAQIQNAIDSIKQVA